MASELQIASWEPWGAAFLSEEQGEGGKLAVDYSSGVDTRWTGQAVLGPLLTTLDCSARGGTTANMNGFAVAPITMQAAGPFLYGSGGTKWAKIALTGGTTALSLSSDGTEGAMGEATTCVLYTKNAAGTEEISFGMSGTAYRVITAVGAGATDTDSANASSAKFSIMALAGSASANRNVAMLGKGTTSVENLVQQNTLSGTVTMATPTLTTIATMAGEAITYTGFAMDGNKWLLGTSNGPYYLDESFRTYAPLIDELDNATGTCSQMSVWGVMNGSVIIPLKRSTRISRNLSGRSVGPEVYRENTSPITGSTHAFCASERWAYFTFYNAVQDKTWLCAARPSNETDWHGYPISYFPIAKLADGVESHAAIFTGTQGNTARTQPMVVIGYDTDVASFNEGRIDRFTDDTGYTYAAAGTLYLTTMKRQAGQYKDIKWFDVETRGCNATQSVTLNVTVTDRYANETTIQVGAPIISNGIHRLYVTNNFPVDKARDVKPQLVFATADSAASPKVVAKVRMAYGLKEMEL